MSGRFLIAADNPQAILHESPSKEMDKAVQACLDFQAANPDTLIVVTGNHECAGVNIIGSSTVTNADRYEDWLTNPAPALPTCQDTAGALPWPRPAFKITPVLAAPATTCTWGINHPDMPRCAKQGMF